MSQTELPELNSRPQGRREWSGAFSSLVLPLAFVAALVGGLLFWQASGGRDQDSAYGTVALPADKNATGQAPQASAGRAAPDFLLAGTDGTVLRLSDQQGRPAVITFFASWCADCRAQMPVVAQAAAEGGQELRFIGINLQESEERVAGFASDYGATFPLLLDRDGDVAATWGAGGPGQPLPATFFIDAAGVIRKVVAGPVTAADMALGISLIGGGQD